MDKTITNKVVPSLINFLNPQKSSTHSPSACSSPLSGLKPSSNVIIRLCSIECDFSYPMTHTTNAKFATDIKAWGNLTNRIWIWNYVTDFANYVMPWPDYHTLIPNTQFFKDNGVTGL